MTSWKEECRELEQKYYAVNSKYGYLYHEVEKQRKLIEKLKKERNELYKRMTGCEYGD